MTDPRGFTLRWGVAERPWVPPRLGGPIVRCEVVLLPFELDPAAGGPDPLPGRAVLRRAEGRVGGVVPVRRRWTTGFSDGGGGLTRPDPAVEPLAGSAPLGTHAEEPRASPGTTDRVPPAEKLLGWEVGTPRNELGVVPLDR
jgi:hypothetical protein